MDRKISINVNACLPEMSWRLYTAIMALLWYGKDRLNQNIINRLKDLDIEIIQVYESSLPHNERQSKTTEKEEANFTESYEEHG